MQQFGQELYKPKVQRDLLCDKFRLRKQETPKQKKDLVPVFEDGTTPDVHQDFGIFNVRITLQSIEQEMHMSSVNRDKS